MLIFKAVGLVLLKLAACLAAVLVVFGLGWLVSNYLVYVLLGSFMILMVGLLVKAVCDEYEGLLFKKELRELNKLCRGPVQLELDLR